MKLTDVNIQQATARIILEPGDVLGDCIVYTGPVIERQVDLSPDCLDKLRRAVDYYTVSPRLMEKA